MAPSDSFGVVSESASSFNRVIMSSSLSNPFRPPTVNASSSSSFIPSSSPYADQFEDAPEHETMASSCVSSSNARSLSRRPNSIGAGQRSTIPTQKKPSRSHSRGARQPHQPKTALEALAMACAVEGDAKNRSPPPPAPAPARAQAPPSASPSPTPPPAAGPAAAGESSSSSSGVALDSLEITRNDILCGRGGLTNHHPGNVFFRKLVRMKQETYLLATKREKAGVAKEIVDAISGLDPPGRFLKKDSKHNGRWTEIGFRKAREKTSQALREGAPELREEMQTTPLTTATTPTPQALSVMGSKTTTAAAAAAAASSATPALTLSSTPSAAAAAATTTEQAMRTPVPEEHASAAAAAAAAAAVPNHHSSGMFAPGAGGTTCSGDVADVILYPASSDKSSASDGSSAAHNHQQQDGVVSNRPRVVSDDTATVAGLMGIRPLFHTLSSPPPHHGGGVGGAANPSAAPMFVPPPSSSSSSSMVADLHHSSSAASAVPPPQQQLSGNPRSRPAGAAAAAALRTFLSPSYHERLRLLHISTQAQYEHQQRMQHYHQQQRLQHQQQQRQREEDEQEQRQRQQDGAARRHQQPQPMEIQSSSSTLSSCSSSSSFSSNPPTSRPVVVIPPSSSSLSSIEGAVAVLEQPPVVVVPSSFASIEQVQRQQSPQDRGEVSSTKAASVSPVSMRTTTTLSTKRKMVATESNDHTRDEDSQRSHHQEQTRQAKVAKRGPRLKLLKSRVDDCHGSYR